MSDKISLLITILYGNELIKCAMKLSKNYFGGDVLHYYMEPENRLLIHSKLPLHVASCGPIVDIEEIFEVEIIKKD